MKIASASVSAEHSSECRREQEGSRQPITLWAATIWAVIWMPSTWYSVTRRIPEVANQRECVQASWLAADSFALKRRATAEAASFLKWNWEASEKGLVR